MTFTTEEALRGEVARLSAIIGEMTGDSDQPIDGLTMHESRIVHVLDRADGLMVKRTTMMDALYFDRYMDDEPEENILAVHICRIRKKRPDIGARLLNIYALGWRLVPA